MDYVVAAIVSITLKEPTFSLVLPAGFQASNDEEGLHCICKSPPAILRFTAEKVEDKDALPNLSRMLAGFLTRMGHPVATDELLKLNSVPGAYGFCWQYAEDDKFQKFWLFGNEASWFFMTLVTAENDKDTLHEPIQQMVKTIRLEV